jgi:DNA-binding NarL/FixJ family response regulator
MTKEALVCVVVADDHPMFRYGVAAVLASAPEIDLVGEAADGGELHTLVEREQPDVVLTDLSAERARFDTGHP